MDSLNLDLYKSQDEIDLVCFYCGVEFYRKKKNLLASMRRTGYGKEGKIRCTTCAPLLNPPKKSVRCKNCKELCSSDNIFCSSSCSATYNNNKRYAGKEKKYDVYISPTTGKKYYKKKKSNICEICGSGYNKVCKKSCERKRYIGRWLSGKETGNGKYRISEVVRDYLLELSDYSCEDCGFNKPNPHTGKSVLHIDHIDGNWKNSSRDNLRVLCPTCHALTDNYGALNMGKGRKWKAEYSQY